MFKVDFGSRIKFQLRSFLKTKPGGLIIWYRLVQGTMGLSVGRLDKRKIRSVEHFVEKGRVLEHCFEQT